MPESLETLLPLLVSYGLRVVGVLLALWIAFRIAAWIEQNLTRTLRSKGVDEALSAFGGNLVRWLLIAAAVLACLGVFGIETTSFAAILGAAGLAIGLAFQGTLANVSAGVMLLTFRPFGIGDLVKVADELGIVKEIGLFVTALDTLDHRRIILPNSVVAAGKIENLTANEHRRVDIDVAVPYEADVEQIRQALEHAAAGVAGRDAELGHQVILLGLGESANKWQVRVWCRTDAYWDVWDATIVAVRRALGSQGIPYAYPKLTVQMQQAS